jgi:hypothetical protein
MKVRFLKDVECIILIQLNCGDPSCCTWREENGIDFFKSGEEAENYIEVSLRNLEEGVDFEYID